MSASVQEWSAAEVAPTDNLPENFLGLLEWVLDESVVAAKDRLDGDFDQGSSQEVVMDSPQAKEITGVVKGHENAEVSPLPKEPLTSEAIIGIDDAQDKSSNKSIVPVEQDQYPPPLLNSQEQACQPKSVSSVGTARKKVLKLASKWKIPSEAIQDQDRATPEAKDSISSWSISALGEDPVTPPVESSPRQGEAENLNNDGPSEKVKELNSAGRPRSLTVAAWVMDTNKPN